MRVYISGRITGDDGYKEKFAAAERRLAELGHNAVNPCRIGEYEFFGYEDFMHIDFALIDVCDAIYMLADWQGSSGARRELQYAEDWQKKIMYQDESTREEGFPIGRGYPQK